MTDEFSRIVSRRNHKRFITLLLLLMILVNIGVRYPLDHLAPMGSDTYFTLDLGRSLADHGQARWILTPLSYLGLYPLSYPSGTPFEYAELHILSGMNWNLIPLTVSLLFTVLLILAGFLLFRAFRLSDELSVILSGLMALSPLFMYFTYQQASGRGFLIPLFMIGLFVVVAPLRRSASIFLVFALITFCGLSLHRSSLLITLFEGMAAIVIALTPIVMRKSRPLKIAAYAVCVVFGLSLIVWPYVPGLRDLIGSITEISSSFRTAEWEFRTGFFFSGDSLFVLLMNLSTNYVGGIGLVLLLLPVGFLSLYPTSRDSRERDIFLIAAFIGFAPFVWKAQYFQLILLPFAYLLAGFAIQRRKRLTDIMASVTKRFRKHRRRTNRARAARLRVAAISTFLVICVVFSIGMFDHRSGITDSSTGERNWPNDSEANLGIYLTAFDTKNPQFVSGSGILDRRIGWFSDWDSPVLDPTALQGSGYLNATKEDFVFVRQGNFISYLMMFYGVANLYNISDTTTGMERNLYDLSWTDIFGFLRLTYEDYEVPWVDPHVTTDQARISIVVEIKAIGNSISNIYWGEGVLESGFLKELSARTYIVYENELYSGFLTAHSS